MEGGDGGSGDGGDGSGDGRGGRGGFRGMRQASLRVIHRVGQNTRVLPSPSELRSRRESKLLSKQEREKMASKRRSFLSRIAGRASYLDRASREFNRWTKDNANEESTTLVDLSKYRSVLHLVVCYAVESHAFTIAIICTIMVNMVTIALETLESFQNRAAEETFSRLSTVFLSIYTVEFLFKIYAEPRNYWRNNYNIMDFVVLAISYVTDVILGQDLEDVDVSFLKLFRALRALRALRSISFIRPLQVLVSALLKTMSSIVYLVALLLLLMFVWAMMGHYAFGTGPDAEPEEWGTIGFSMYQLWVLVTLDSWTDVQDKLVLRGFSLGTVSLFIVPWIFIGNFIFTNLFIGVVVQNLEEAQSEEKAVREAKRNELFRQKKSFIIEKQKRDLEQLMNSQEKHGKLSLDDFLRTLAGTLDHDDVAPIKTPCCSRLWFETYLESMTYYEKGRQRVQFLHLRTAEKLHEMLEHRMLEMRSGSAQNIT